MYWVQSLKVVWILRKQIKIFEVIICPFGKFFFIIIVFISNAILADTVQTEASIWIPSSLLSPEFNSKKTSRQFKIFITQSFSNVTKSYLVTCYWKRLNLGEIWTLGLIVGVACKESPGTKKEKWTFLEFLFHSFGQIFLHSSVSAQV